MATETPPFNQDGLARVCPVIVRVPGKPARVAVVAHEYAFGWLAVRTWMGRAVTGVKSARIRWSHTPVTVHASAVVRDASPREVALGFPVDPLAPRH